MNIPPDLNEMAVFVKVVEEGSFVGAGRALGMPTSTVSRRIASLEGRLGARLLHRTTRQVRATDVGQTFYDRASRVVTEAAEAEQVVLSTRDIPHGSLRVTAPVLVAQRVLTPVALEFLATWPEVQFDIASTDRVVDVVGEGFDVALRAGPFDDSSLVVRKLIQSRLCLVAAPSYIAAYGAPQEPEELGQHGCLSYRLALQRSWTLHGPRGEVRASVAGRMATNDLSVTHAAVLAGLGIGLLPQFTIEPELQDGKLVRVLPEWCGPDLWLGAVYPSARHLPTKVRAFIDALAAHLELHGLRALA